MLVESTTTNSASATTSLTLTKPTGLQEGELLVAILSTYSPDGNAGGGSWSELTDWTEATFNDDNVAGYHSIQYIIATATEVAASNFTFSVTATADRLEGTLLRVSGNNPMSPLGTTDTHTDAVGAGATFSGALTPYTPAADGALVIIQIGGKWTTGSTARTVSTYTTTTSGITFTEAYDVNETDGSGGSVVAAAYGIQGTAAELSAYGASFSTTVDDHFGQMAVFLPPVNASGENALVTTASTAFTASGTADAIVAENSLVTATAAANVQSGKGESPTPFSNTTKSNPTWTNQTKS